MKNENMIKIDGRNVSTEIFDKLLDLTKTFIYILGDITSTVDFILRITNLPVENYCHTVLKDFVDSPEKYLHSESNLKTFYDAVVCEFGEPYIGDSEEDPSHRNNYEYILSEFKSSGFIE